MLGPIHVSRVAFLLSADFFKIKLFGKILSGIPLVSNRLDPD